MATFEAIALQCAAGVALDVLAAIASVESGMRPLAIRDGDRIIHVNSTGEGVAVTVGITDQGREPGIGLMGVTPQQMRAVGISLQDGFDACNSLKAAAQVFAVSNETAAQRGLIGAAAERHAIRQWWRPDSRFPSAATLDAAVARERSQAASLIKKELGNPVSAPKGSPGTPTSATPAPRVAIAPDCWDIFARHRAGLSQCEPANSAPAVSAQPRPPTPQSSAFPSDPNR